MDSLPGLVARIQAMTGLSAEVIHIALLLLAGLLAHLLIIGVGQFKGHHGDVRIA